MRAWYDRNGHDSYEVIVQRNGYGSVWDAKRGWVGPADLPGFVAVVLDPVIVPAEPGWTVDLPDYEDGGIVYTRTERVLAWIIDPNGYDSPKAIVPGYPGGWGPDDDAVFRFRP